jgi:hypothetical protein
MKKIKFIGALALCSLIAVSCETEPVSNLDLTTADLKSSTGNDAPSGAHFNLNIIGMSKEKSADMTDNNGHRIFVPLEGQTKIMLIEGDDFAVLDANGTDGRAEFQLPNPDPDGDGVSSYSIYVRALGKPGGKAVITTCADADLTDDYYEVCSAESLEVESSRGPAKFVNVSRTLLTIYVDETFTFTDGDGNEVEVKKGRYTIFDPIFEDYFWKYDNNGLRLLQLRFYEIPSDIS